MPSLTRRQTLAACLLAGQHAHAHDGSPDDSLCTPWPSAQATPPLALPRWEGERWQLSDQRGQIVLLNFWASWCEPCRSELPALELLAHRHEADGLQVITINYRETDVALRRFLNQMPCNLPILRDVDGSAARAWSVRIFPTTVAIGRDGRALSRCVGEIDWSSPQARRWLKRLLG